jgi:hypothetical protein
MHSYFTKPKKTIILLLCIQSPHTSLSRSFGQYLEHQVCEVFTESNLPHVTVKYHNKWISSIAFHVHRFVRLFILWCSGLIERQASCGLKTMAEIKENDDDNMSPDERIAWLRDRVR